MLTPKEIEIKLEGYPSQIISHYCDYYETKDSRSLEKFVVGVLLFLEDDLENTTIDEMDDSCKLREDLGVNSITIAEFIFLLEEIFNIEIENKDIVEITTLGSLRKFISLKVS